MKYTLNAVALLYLLVAAFLSGCSTPKDEGRNHFLWKVSDENSSVYLLGSVHFADSSFYPLDSVIVNAFDCSDELAVEIDVSDTAIVRKTMVLSTDLGSFKDGKTLDMILPEDVLYSLDSLCLSWYISSDFLYGYKPWAAAMTLSSLALQRLGLDFRLGIDLFFLTQARKSNKKIISLESVEDQVRAFTGEGSSDSLGIFYLKSLMKEITWIDSSVALFMRAWKTGNDSLFRVAQNMTSVDELSHSDSLLLNEINERIYFSRNRKMADSVVNFLANDRRAFVVVGAAHLVHDKENVISILRRKGLTVERL